MKIELTKKVENVTLIEGFPGFGLVGTIATEYLLQHLDFEFIGKFWLEELPATVVIHDSTLVHPIGIYYNKKHNVVLVHAITGTDGTEWLLADVIAQIAEQVKAKEILTLEGVGTATPLEETSSFYYTTNKDAKKKLKESKVQPLKEGIIMGVTAALLLKTKRPITALFADTHSNLPDSKAAAKIIEALDVYLGMNVEIKPLLETAEKFEEKLKGLLQQNEQAKEQVKKKQLSYVG